MTTLATIGYQGTTVLAFRRTLEDAGIELLVDIRAVASSRLPGFSKTKLAANVDSVGIDYLHLRDLGTPAEGRAAARAGHHADMRKIFLAHLETPEARAALDELEQLVRSKRRVCVLCFEADPLHCHRAIVAESLAKRMRLSIVHLRPTVEPPD